MPQIKKQPAKKPVKKSGDNSKKLEQAVTFLIDELDDVEGPSDEELNQIEEEETAEEMLQQLLEELYG